MIEECCVDTATRRDLRFRVFVFFTLLDLGIYALDALITDFDFLFSFFLLLVWRALIFCSRERV